MPGQEFLVLTDGELHSMFVPLAGPSPGPRWLGFEPGSGRIRVEQLTTRDPRTVWDDPRLVEFAAAAKAGYRGAPDYQWFMEGVEEEGDPDGMLSQLLADALAELR